MHVVYFYTEANPTFGKWLKEDIKKYNLQLEPDYRPWDNPIGGSDNGPFAKAGVPIIWYHTDGHPDYHQPSDHADKLNWEKESGERERILNYTFSNSLYNFCTGSPMIL